jgi:N-methylhydantoinase A
MKSDGGVISARHARQQAILTALSGPAAGVIGAFHLARLAGFEQVITLDMGGTSTDVALCPGALIRRAESEIDGLPLRIRLLDIETVGAGGGSIARVDSGGALRVGPESAGADPGPIVYRRGGDAITVSDANAVLGRLDADHFLGGAMRLDVDAARDAIEALAQVMRVAPETAALGIVRVANQNIDRALRRVSIARGYDPRGFTLVAFGGAGPLHACEIADGLGIRRVMVPRYPGVLCALGLLVADVTLDYSRALLGSSSDPHDLLDQMTAQARADLAREGIAESAMILTPLIDARYRGQAYELTIPFGTDPVSEFHEAHRRAYGHALFDRSVEWVTVRLQATGVVDKPRFTPERLDDHVSPDTARIGWKIAAGERTALLDRERLAPGCRFGGAALIVQMDSTTYIPRGWVAQVDGYRNLVLRRSAE